MVQRDLNTPTAKIIRWQSNLRGSVPNALVLHRDWSKSGTILHETLEACGMADAGFKVWCQDSIMRKLVVLGTEQGVLKSPPCPGWLVNVLSNHGVSHLQPMVACSFGKANGGSERWLAVVISKSWE